MNFLSYCFEILNSTVNFAVPSLYSLVFLIGLTIIFVYFGFKWLVRAIFFGFCLSLVSMPVLDISTSIFYEMFIPMTILTAFSLLNLHDSEGKTKSRFLDDIKRFFIIITAVSSTIVVSSFNFDSLVLFIEKLNYTGVVYSSFFLWLYLNTKFIYHFAREKEIFDAKKNEQTT